jgi:hypothetical protein
MSSMDLHSARRSTGIDFDISKMEAPECRFTKKPQTHANTFSLTLSDFPNPKKGTVPVALLTLKITVRYCVGTVPVRKTGINFYIR